MDRNSEKLGVDQIDDNAAYHTDSHILDHEFTPAEQKRIIQRIDRRLVTTVGFMYCVSLMDRTNLGAAVIAGMGTELMLIGERYVSEAITQICLCFCLTLPGQSIITLLFFVTYIIFQPPSTVICRALGPRFHLAGITLLWGSCMIGMGFVKKWDQLAGLRIILGLLEAGFFPSCVYLLSTWYTRCK